MGNETSILDQAFAGIPKEVLIPTLVGMIIGCLIAAFFSYRLLKLEIVLSAAMYGFEFGYVTLGMAIGERISAFNASVVLGIACAIIFALIAIKVYKALIYFVGGFFGVFFGLLIPIVVFDLLLDVAWVGIVLGIICAIALAVPAAKLFYKKIFKPYYIFFTSLAGMLGAAVVTSLLIFGDNPAMLGFATLLGLVLSIPAMIFQAKINRGRALDD